VLDPFAGSGTTLAVATGCGREAIGIELYEANAELIRDRLGMFLTVDGEGAAGEPVDIDLNGELL
jgi:site-specific DNA-methyltransferase (adenine-specific)